MEGEGKKGRRRRRRRYSCSKTKIGTTGGPVVRTPPIQCRGLVSIPGGGTEIPYAVRHGQKIFKNKF